MGEAARSIFSASLCLLAGYSFIRLSFYRRFTAEHLRTDKFALHVLGFSFVLFLLGQVLAEFLPDWTPAFLVPIQDGLLAAGITAPVMNAIAMGIVFANLDNCRIRFLMRNDGSVRASANILRSVRMTAVARFVRQSSNSALHAIFRATILQKPLMITLKSHKVYVGKPYVVLWEDPTQALTFLKILPTKSGYRDPLTKKVSLPTRYKELSERLIELPDETPMTRVDQTNPLASDFMDLTDRDNEIVARVDIEDLGVAIAWDEVESVTIFEEHFYQALQEQQPDPDHEAGS